MSPKDDRAFSIREVDECIRRGNEAVKKGQLDVAYLAWKQAIDIDPTRKPALEKGIGQLRAKLIKGTLEKARQAGHGGNQAEAIVAYRRLLDFDPDEGDRQEAVEWLEGNRKKTELTGRAVTVLALAGMTLGTAAVAYFVYRVLQ